MTLQALRNKVAAGVTGEWTFEGLGDAEDLAHEAFHGSLDAAKALHDALLPGVGVDDPRQRRTDSAAPERSPKGSIG